MDPSAEPETTADGADGADGAEGSDDLGEESDPDEDAPRVVGKPISKADGKVFYEKLVKGDETLKVGQDVYLENNMDIPYVARLQDIFTYSFAPTEVYFNARWYYRVGDCHEHAEKEVRHKGNALAPHEKELFFSLHDDENHADCILRSCQVNMLLRGEEPSLSVWDAVADSAHEYIVWRAYGIAERNVYALTELPSKKLRDACDLEVKRGPTGLERRLSEPAKRRAREADMSGGPLANDELLAIWLPRKDLEVWLDTDSFKRVATGILVRCSQILNGVRTFFAGYVTDIKRTARPYKLGQRVAEVALQVRTRTGTRLVDLTALSNVECTAKELEQFKVPLDPVLVRKKARSLQRAMQEESNLFEEEELRRRQEKEEQLRLKREEDARAREREEEERERKERERDEVRRRAAAPQKETEAWWLQYQTKAGDKDREIAKVKSRLARFKKIAASSTSKGERDNAFRLAQQAEAKLNSLMAENEENDGAGGEDGEAAEDGEGEEGAQQ